MGLDLAIVVRDAEKGPANSSSHYASYVQTVMNAAMRSLDCSTMCTAHMTLLQTHAVAA